MAVQINPPPEMEGDARNALRRTYSYLYQLSQTLNAAMNNLTMDNFAPEAGEALRAATEKAAGSAQEQQAQERLKALVVKTAREVKLTMDLFEKKLAMEYLAVSDFGKYLQLNESVIQATAQGVVQLFTGYESAESFQESQASFTEYVTETKQYIRSGYLYDETDESGVSYPRYGVAVGENLTTVMVDGKEVLNRGGYVVTHTSDEVAFWVEGVKVAYISNAKLYVAVIEVTERIQLGAWRMGLDAGGSLDVGGGAGSFVQRFEAGCMRALEKGEEIFRLDNRELTVHRIRMDQEANLGALQLTVLADGKIRAALAE